MVKYVLKRIALMFFVFFTILTVCFVLVKLLPLVDAKQFGKDMNLIQQRREALGYNKPILIQYLIFLKRSVLGGDWGISEALYRSQDVWKVFTSKLPATMMVNIYSMIFAIPSGLLLGIFAALKKNKWQDYLISTLVMVFISVPSYVYALLIQYLLCYKLKLFPLQMNSGTNYFSLSMFRSVMPAVLALAFGSIASLARYVRAELSEVLTSDFMLLARTKGLTRSQATIRHAMRNSMVPVFPMILGEFVGILGGSLIIETIFGVPGVGQLYLNSITARDYNFFMLLSAFYTLIGLVSGLVVDISYGFIDPRDIRYHKTVQAIKNALLYKGLMYRYKSHDDFGLPSSAFTICTFWLIRALYVIGEKEEARSLFEEMLHNSNHLGLFSEDIDFETKEQLGNFPQAYSHLALVNTAILFSEEDIRLFFK